MTITLTKESRDRMEEMARNLEAEFAGRVGLETVQRCVADARARYDGAKIDVYLPLFVARRARELLLAAGSAKAV